MLLAVVYRHHSINNRLSSNTFLGSAGDDSYTELWIFCSKTVCVVLAPRVGRLKDLLLKVDLILPCVFNPQMLCACCTTVKTHEVWSAATPMLPTQASYHVCNTHLFRNLTSIIIGEENSNYVSVHALHLNENMHLIYCLKSMPNKYYTINSLKIVLIWITNRTLGKQDRLC